MKNVIGLPILFLLFTLSACQAKMPVGQTISAKNFVLRLSESLGNSEKLRALVEVYKNKLYGDVGFSDTKPIMSYLAIQSDLEKKSFTADILADYSKRKAKFKDRLSLVSTKEIFKSSDYPDKRKTTDDLEMFYAEFLKTFMAYNGGYFTEMVLEKIKNNKKLDCFDKAFFWLKYVNDNPYPFEISADNLDLKILPILNSQNLIILFGERENTGFSYQPYHYNLATGQVLACTSDTGDKINFMAGYGPTGEIPSLEWKSSVLSYIYQEYSYKYFFDSNRKTWSKMRERSL